MFLVWNDFQFCLTVTLTERLKLNCNQVAPRSLTEACQTDRQTDKTDRVNQLLKPALRDVHRLKSAFEEHLLTKLPCSTCVYSTCVYSTCASTVNMKLQCQSFSDDEENQVLRSDVEI